MSLLEQEAVSEQKLCTPEQTVKRRFGPVSRTMVTQYLSALHVLHIVGTRLPVRKAVAPYPVRDPFVRASCSPVFEVAGSGLVNS